MLPSAFQKYGSCQSCTRLSTPLKWRPLSEARFQSVKAIEMPNRVGKITTATVNSAAGRMNSARIPCSPRIITRPAPSAIDHRT